MKKIRKNIVFFLPSFFVLSYHIKELKIKGDGMLRLTEIKKTYKRKDYEVHALKGISLSFRDNEFVSILGPSGCGKTTLLNILGGLDHYTSGDLAINGRSTKDFSDRDWDVYRNHRIGFVFQSYNLIPQENILENVELALTISGIGKAERERRAKAVLDEVGLKGRYKKKPNQLSGGQCQRVAIARALVNEPEILLADEPTGALDSKTSVQIRELIKRVSQKRLVIMVTHNPELAKIYSSRIISLLDGQVISDSNPLTRQEEEKAEKEAKDYPLLSSSKESAKKEKAKRSWWTAFKLSAKNLLAKKNRTVRTVIAASIGIIGVSAVLAVSQGVTNYRGSRERQRLSGNPVYVSKQTRDLSSLRGNRSSSSAKEAIKESTQDGKINVDFRIKKLIEQEKRLGSAMVQNEITEDYINYLSQGPSSLLSSLDLDYGIDPSNNIYTQDYRYGHSKDEKYSLSSLRAFARAIIEEGGREDGQELSSISSRIGELTSFSQCLSNQDYILTQYDIMAGHYATEPDERRLVVSSKEEVTDLSLALLGYYDQDDIMRVINKYRGLEYDEEKFNERKQVAYQEIRNKDYYYYPNDVVFQKNTSSSSSLRPYYYSYQPKESWNSDKKARKRKVVGIRKPKENRRYSSLSAGFYYTPAFAKKYIEDNYSSGIVSFLKDYREKNPSRDGYTSGERTTTDSSGNTSTIDYGIYYKFSYQYHDPDKDVTDSERKTGTSFIGSYSSSLASIFSMLRGASGGKSSQNATLTPRRTGGEHLPSTINFYPKDFPEKDVITSYLDKWNSDEDIVLSSGKVLTKDDRKDIKYTDNVALVVSRIDRIIKSITIALIAFTSLSLVVSTVRISIITYVSVRERIKEIGVIRALGGRKKDVSHLFNAESRMIGLSSGLFGIVFTYIFQVLFNVIIHAKYSYLSGLAALAPWTALVVLLISIILTSIAGLVPALSAAKKDPVEALRSE